MPVKKENKHLYSPDFEKLREERRAKCDNRCELCFVPDHGVIKHAKTRPASRIARTIDIYAVEDSYADACAYATECNRSSAFSHAFKFRPIKLTLAHIDQDPTNNDACNLLLLCQRCHNRIDAPHRKKNAAATLRKKQLELLKNAIAHYTNRAGAKRCYSKEGHRSAYCENTEQRVAIGWLLDEELVEHSARLMGRTSCDIMPTEKGLRFAEAQGL